MQHGLCTQEANCGCHKRQVRILYGECKDLALVATTPGKDGQLQLETRFMLFQESLSVATTDHLAGAFLAPGQIDPIVCMRRWSHDSLLVGKGKEDLLIYYLTGRFSHNTLTPSLSVL